MLVVADTSALVALAACDALALLDHLFGDVRVPTAVLRECAVAAKPNAAPLAGYLVGKAVDADLHELTTPVTGLGQGEREAMALYKQLQADFLLADDARARSVAQRNDIAVVGSLGVLLLARSRQVIPAVKPRLKAMQDAGIYFSDRLLSEALRLAGEAD